MNMKQFYLSIFIWMVISVVVVTLVEAAFIQVGNSTDDGNLTVSKGGVLIPTCLRNGVDCPSGLIDTIWSIAGSIYLANFSNVLDIDSTILNMTIDDRRTIDTNITDTIWNIVGSIYLINLTNILDINSTVLNMTIDDRRTIDTNITDTIWNIMGSIYLINLTNVLDINSTVLNMTIDSRAGSGSNETDLIVWTNDSNGIFIKSGYPDMVGIGTNTPSHNLDVHGHMEIEHTADETNDHALEIHMDTAAFGGTKAVAIFYETGEIVVGVEEEAIVIQIDQSNATGGDVSGMEVLSTEGSAEVFGLKIGVLINPIHQDSGTFVDMDSANNSGTDDLAAFTNSLVNVQMFVNDDDYVIIGDANKFEVIEFLLQTPSSGAGIKPVFEFSTGVDTWTVFSPTDGTGGMHNTGIISFESGNLVGWVVGAGSEFFIRITRTRNVLTTVPIELLVQISAATAYSWDQNGDIIIRNIISSGSINATGTINATVDLCTLGLCLTTVHTFINNLAGTDCTGITNFAVGTDALGNIVCQNVVPPAALSEIQHEAFIYNKPNVLIDDWEVNGTNLGFTGLFRFNHTITGNLTLLNDLVMSNQTIMSVNKSKVSYTTGTGSSLQRTNRTIYTNNLPYTLNVLINFRSGQFSAGDAMILEAFSDGSLVPVTTVGFSGMDGYDGAAAALGSSHVIRWQLMFSVEPFHTYMVNETILRAAGTSVFADLTIQQWIEEYDA